MNDSGAGAPLKSPDRAPLHPYGAHVMAAVSGAIAAALLRLPFAQPGERVIETPLGVLTGFLVMSSIRTQHMRDRTLWYSFGFVAFMAIIIEFSTHHTW